jgi:PIN domain nuclease of toxin-antitoxin system
VRYLVDTHVLIWQAQDSERLPSRAKELLQDPRNTFVLSVVSLWEILIKNSRSRGEFLVDPAHLRNGLLRSEYEELSVTAEHVLEVGRLDRLHNDPFDRLLLAQARVENVSLLTADRALLAYGAPTQSV